MDSSSAGVKKTASRRRPINACIECRSAKVRCDAVDTFTIPCKRCRKRGLNCIVDETVERNPVRERMKAMKAELDHLRNNAKTTTSPSSVEEGSPAASLTTSPPALSTQPTTSTRNLSTPGTSSERRASPVQIPWQSMAGQPAPAQLGALILSWDVVAECFEIYRSQFYPHLPLVNTAISPVTLLQASPFLFWTIIDIVGDRVKELASEIIWKDFSQHFQALAKQTMLSPPLSLLTIQAILHMCYWPEHVNFQFGDPGPLYSSLAIEACHFLNLPRTSEKLFYQGGQISPAALESMNKTWLATFLVSTTTTMYFGDNHLIKHHADLAAIQSRVNRPGIARSLAAQVTMFTLAVKHSSLITTLDLNSHESVLEMHWLEVENIANQYSDIWTDHLAFLLLVTKLHMCIPFLLRHARTIANSTTPTPPHTLLLRAITDATAMITLFTTLTPPSHPPLPHKPHPAFWTLPKPYFRALCHAISFLLKFLPSPLLPTALATSIRTHLIIAIDALARATRGPMSEPFRASRMFKSVLDHGAGMLRAAETIAADRGAGAVFWDVMHLSYRLRGFATFRTDLLDLVEPLRGLSVGDGNLGGGAGGSVGGMAGGMQGAGSGEVGNMAVGMGQVADVDMINGMDDWIGSIGELSDLGLLYLPDAWAMDPLVS